LSGDDIVNCDRTKEISLLIDGELGPAQARSVEHHLDGCADCRQVRADFLTFRRGIAEYPLLDPTATRQALAKVMSHRGAVTADKREIRSRARIPFAEVFSGLRFNPVLVTIATLLLTGTIAFVLYRARQDNHSSASAPPVTENSAATTANTNSPSRTPVADGLSGSAESDVTHNGSRKIRRVRPREPETTKGKPTSPLSPTRERAKPKSLPQVRSAAPPTFARLNERAMPTRDQVALAFDPGSGNLRHLEQSELLLREFRNIRLDKGGVSSDVSHERRRAQRLVYQNMLLRREADAAGNIEVATLLASLEPILLDIAHLSHKPRNEEVKVIRERVERQSLVPLLQVSSLAVLRSND
jgi:hypothetical protein